MLLSFVGYEVSPVCKYDKRVTNSSIKSLDLRFKWKSFRVGKLNKRFLSIAFQGPKLLLN